MDTKCRVFIIALAVLFAAAGIIPGRSAKAASAYSAENGALVFRLRDVDFSFDTESAPEGYRYEGSFVAQSDYSSSLNLLRVIKNRYYNALDGALGEDRTIAHLLYRLFDFVYGDAILDLFTDCFADEETFTASLAAMNYTDVTIYRIGAWSVVVNASFFGASRELTAEYDPEADSARLSVYEDEELITSMEWRAVDEGYALQYMRRIGTEEFLALYGSQFASAEQADEDEITPVDNELYQDASSASSFSKQLLLGSGLGSTAGASDDEGADGEDEPSYSAAAVAAAELCSYIGYRAYLRDDGTGAVSHGPFSSLRDVDLLTLPRVTAAMVSSRMFCCDKFSMDDREVIFSDRSGTIAHELGAVEAAPADSADAAPDDDIIADAP